MVLSHLWVERKININLQSLLLHFVVPFLIPAAVRVGERSLRNLGVDSTADIIIIALNFAEI